MPMRQTTPTGTATPTRRTRREKLLRYLLPLLVLLLAFALMQLLLSRRQAPEPGERLDPGPLVEVLTVQPGDHRVLVQAAGTVRPRREIDIVPRVAGEVVELGPNFLAGGLVAAGELLLRLDPIDFQLARQRALAAVVRAEVRREDIRERATIARQEWELFPDSPNRPEPSPLALFEPQLREAEADLSAARADLRAAELNLERTVIRAPFAGRIRERRLATGQFINAGAAVAILTGSNQVEVVVPLPAAELAWLDLPRSTEDRPGSAALITLTAGEQTHQWPGEFNHTLGEVEQQGRMIRAVVLVENPFASRLESSPRKSGSDPDFPAADFLMVSGPDLLPGMFVRVQLAGRRLEEVFILPRRALRENDRVWLLDRENRLRIRPVSVIRREREEVVIDRGLAAGDRVILTDLAGAVEGLQLRINDRPTDQPGISEQAIEPGSSDRGTPQVGASRP